MRARPELLVTIDGPSGAGKTTVGLLLARRLEAQFVDTGVFYRAVTWLALEQGISPQDSGVSRLAADLDITFQEGPDLGDEGEVLLGGRVVTSEIRSPAVESRVSEVASHASVRAALLPVQRGAARSRRVVAVGRDLGTVVFPDADVKVYLDASLEERARRRALEWGQSVELNTAAEAIDSRDALDRGRTVAPLVRPPDAVVVWTDGLSVHQVVERLYQLVLERQGIVHG